MQFSVIIPVYNKKDTVTRSLESVLNQNFDKREYEIIIVDDGSSDDDYTRLERPGVRVIQQSNGGVSKARNTGIKNSKGDYICFLDADDYYLPNNLAVLHQAIEKTGGSYYCTIPVIRFSDGSYSTERPNVLIDGRIEEVDIFDYYLSHPFTFIHTNSVCVKKQLLEKNRFEEGIKIGEDFDLWFRLGMQSKLSIIFSNTIVYDRTESTATKDRNVIVDWIFARRTEADSFYVDLDQKTVDNIKTLVDRYRLTEAREYIIKNEKNKALSSIKKVQAKKGWRYFATCLFIYCPQLLRRYAISVYDKYQDR